MTIIILDNVLMMGLIVLLIASERAAGNGLKRALVKIARGLAFTDHRRRYPLRHLGVAAARDRGQPLLVLGMASIVFVLDHAAVMRILVLEASLPIAVAVFVLADQYRMDTSRISAAILVSTWLGHDHLARPHPDRQLSLRDPGIGTAATRSHPRASSRRHPTLSCPRRQRRLPAGLVAARPRTIIICSGACAPITA